MTLGGVNPGDIVLADRKGGRFYALVAERRKRELQVEPIGRRVTYRHVKARESDRHLAKEPRPQSAGSQRCSQVRRVTWQLQGRSRARLGQRLGPLVTAEQAGCAVNAARVSAAKPIGRPAQLARD